MPRGMKTCSACRVECGPRTLKCKCGQAFPSRSKEAQTQPSPQETTPPPTESIDEVPVERKKRKRKLPTSKYKRVEDFRTLRRGNRIKIHQGGGPYYELADKSRVRLVEKGFATVDSVLRNGITVYEKNGGYAFLYMGRKKKSPIFDSVRLVPCKISLLRESSDND